MAKQPARLVWKGQAAISRMRAASSRGVERVARAYIQECLHLVFDTPKTGRIYGGHQASAPGEPAASDKGTYVGSFKLETKELRAGPVARVTNSSDHALKLEFGTVRMKPRPVMTPALRNMGQGAFRMYYNEWAAEFKKK